MKNASHPSWEIFSGYPAVTTPFPAAPLKTANMTPMAQLGRRLLSWSLPHPLLQGVVSHTSLRYQQIKTIGKAKTNFRKGGNGTKQKRAVRLSARYIRGVAATQGLTVRPASYISNTCLHLPKAPRIHHTAGCVRETKHRKQENEARNCYRVPGQYCVRIARSMQAFEGESVPPSVRSFARDVPVLRYGGVEDVTSSYYTHDTQLSSPHKTLQDDSKTCAETSAPRKIWTHPPTHPQMAGLSAGFL